MNKITLIIALLLTMCFADEKQNDFIVEHSSAMIDHVQKDLHDYINGGNYPQVASYVSLPATYADFRGEKSIDNYLNAYFTESEQYFYSLSKKQAQNDRYLESLLLSNKKILVFLNISQFWQQNIGNIVNVSARDKNIDLRGVVVTGFDRDARYFIVKDGAKTIMASYDYIKQNAQSGFYHQQSKQSPQLRNVNFELTRWAFGKGNLFKPKARVYGKAVGHPAFIKWVRMVVEYSGKKRVVLKQQTTAPDADFMLRDTYYRLGSRYGILECMNDDLEVTRFIKRPVDSK
ncbi:hypothetical protein [Candidatus Uabimicrobium amorphum]|uniref:Uncharacterized protein n=1 Tax=Uabimicrobium amorphum TaxID=2596890 RepID=A0A5S9INM5_UABAM|nr:hypothetical protein [Candidatus Uabimicrobium amorphum]BBM85228.1 hypothetical protein UABAM_03591 [Candidatus Uabimicrobium amorphum]